MTKKEKMLENIYDLIKESFLAKKQNDEWAKLSRKHTEEAKKELYRWGKNKSIEWNNENKTIKIGRDFILKLS